MTMKINGETQLKDLIPEGYEPSGTSGMSLCRGEEHITVSIKKKEVKDFKWYVKNYFSVLFNSGVINGFNTYTTNILQKEYHKLPFEFKIGLLKFICDDFGVPFRLFLSGEYSESPKYGTEIRKLKSICPPEFINSILK